MTRAYANLANEMSAAGYSDAEDTAIKAEIAHYAAVRDEVKLGAGEDVDFKQYEAGMRFLLDTYMNASSSEVVSDFEDTGLTQLIVQFGAGALDTAAGIPGVSEIRRSAPMTARDAVTPFMADVQSREGHG